MAKCGKHFDTYFRPNIAYLSIVGDVDLSKAKGLAMQYFGQWEQAQVPTATYATPAVPPRPVVAMANRSSSVQSVIRVCYPIDLKPGNPDRFAARVANSILGEGSTGRLFKNLRETHAYTYGAYSNLSTDRLVGEFAANASVRNAVTDSAIAEILVEMKRLRAEKVSDEELQLNKNKLIGEFALSLESPQTIAGFATSIHRNKLPKDFYKNYLKNLQAVTAEDVMRVAQKYIHPENCYIVVVGKASEVADKLSRFGEVKHYDVFGNQVEAPQKALPAGLTAEKVLDNYFQALGGLDALNGIKDFKVVYSGAVMGQNITITNLYLAPNLFKSHVNAGMFTQNTGYDGKEGYMINSMAPEKALEGDQLKEQMEGAEPYGLRHHQKRGYKLKLEGTEQVDGKQTYVVQVDKGYKQETLYIDSESWLLVQQRSAQEGPGGAKVDVAISFSDYKPVKGILYPHKIIQGMGPQNIELEATSIEVNSKLKKKLFKR